MNRWILTLALTAAAALPAQDIDLLKFDNLRSKATDVQEVNLTEPMLKMAAGFLGGGDPKQDSNRKLIDGLKGVFIRSFKFDREGQYSGADVDGLRKQLTGSGWQTVVDVRSTRGQGDNAGIYMRTDGARMTGLVILSMQPKELTVVNISGSLDPSQLQALSGTLGIPNFNIGFDQNKDKKSKEE